jgi:hypothetical protein
VPNVLNADLLSACARRHSLNKELGLSAFRKMPEVRMIGFDDRAERAERAPIIPTQHLDR